MRASARVIFLALGLAGTAPAALADISGGWAVPSLDTAQSIMRDVINREMIDRQVLKNAKAKEGRPDGSAADDQPENILRFNPVERRQRQNIAQFVDAMRKTDPEVAARITPIFTSRDVIGVIGKAIAVYGLQTNDVADAYAVYLTNVWLGTQGRADDLPKAHVVAVRNQAAALLLQSPGFTTLNDAQKQAMAETMLLQATVISIRVNTARTDPVLLARLQGEIARQTKASGLDIGAMALTEAGFKPSAR